MRFAIFIAFVCELFSFAIFARIILSWFLVRRDNPGMIILYKITEPLLAPLRSIIPRVGRFDFTPLVAIVILQIIGSLVR